MDYTSFPTILPIQAAQGSNNQVSAKNIFGGGTLPSGTNINIGGSGGVYVDGAQGIYAGSSTFSQAPFSVDLSGNLVASNVTIQTSSTGRRVVLTPAIVGGFPGNQILFYNALNGVDGAIYSTSASMFLVGATPSLAYYKVNSSGVNSLELFGDSSVIISTSNTMNLNAATVAVGGNFTVSGTKAFDIEHPTKAGKRLRYIAAESPEVLVICRGKGAVAIPDHFTAVSEPGTVQIVQGTDPTTGLSTWIATAVRKGYAGFTPEYAGTVPDDFPVTVIPEQSQTSPNFTPDGSN